MLEDNKSRTPFELMAKVGRALASPQRLRLLHLLAQGERSVEDLASAMEEPIGITSHHLQQLSAVNLVAARKNGRRVIYSMAAESVLRFWLVFRDFSESRMGEMQLLRQLLAAERGAQGKIDLRELQRECARGDVVLLDVRPHVEFQSGHIPGALSMPVEELPKQANRLPKGKTIILYCRGPYCLLAFKARQCLAERGIRALCLSEGPLEWAAANLPLQRDEPVSKTSSPLAKRKTKI